MLHTPLVLLHIFTARIRRMVKVLFSQVCVCPHWEWGLPHSLIPGPFSGVTPGPGSFPGLWYQILSQRGTPVPTGVPQSQAVVPQSQAGGTPVPCRGYPFLGVLPQARTGLGYPQPRQDWGTSLARQNLSKTEQQSKYLLCSGQYSSYVHVLTCNHFDKFICSNFN